MMQLLFVIFITGLLSGCGSDGTDSGDQLVPGTVLYMSASWEEHGDRIIVKWSDFPEAESYQVFRSSTDESGSESEYEQIDVDIREFREDSNFCEDTDVRHYKTYKYRVRAVNSEGVSPFSPVHTGKTTVEKEGEVEYTADDPDSLWDRGLDSPSGVAVAANGSLYVADTGNSRISVFSPDSDRINFNVITNLFDLKAPSGIAAYTYGNTDEDVFVYVADTGGHRITRHNYEGAYLMKWGVSTAAEPVAGDAVHGFNSPGAVAVDRYGNLFVADTGNNRIKVFGPEGNLQGIWCTAEYKYMEAQKGPITQWFSFSFSWWNCDLLYLMYYAFSQFYTDKDIAIPSGEFGGLNQPSGIAVDLDGCVYVADTGNHRVQKFKWDNTGKSLSHLGWWGLNHYEKHSTAGWHESDGGNGTAGGGNGEFESPCGISVDLNGYVYVSDSALNRIQKFTHMGEYITQFEGKTAGQCRGIAAEGNQYIYVADALNNCVMKYTRQAAEQK